MSTSYRIDETETCGGRTEVLTFGTGERTLVILPGLSVTPVLAGAETIVSAYRSFCKDFTVRLVDRRKDPPPGFTLEGMAKDAAAALDALGVTAAHVYGVSQGGMIAQLLALERPELVKKLALCSTLSRENETVRAVVTEWIDMAKAGRGEELNDAFLQKILSPKTYRRFGKAILKTLPVPTARELEIFCVNAMAGEGFDVLDRLPEIRCPSLVLGAENDRVTTAEGARETAAGIGCACKLYPAPYGHAVYDEAPGIKARVRRFLLKE
ncbi:MAG: alpha/beta hydrolase [Clostridia bacterium]|nr:alpha/beta hydrolase [Clostridia bacterium]